MWGWSQIQPHLRVEMDIEPAIEPCVDGYTASHSNL